MCKNKNRRCLEPVLSLTECCIQNHSVEKPSRSIIKHLSIVMTTRMVLSKSFGLQYQRVSTEGLRLQLGTLTLITDSEPTKEQMPM